MNSKTFSRTCSLYKNVEYGSAQFTEYICQTEVRGLSITVLKFFCVKSEFLVIINLSTLVEIN